MFHFVPARAARLLAAAVLSAILLLAAATQASAQWRPARLTILLGHTADGIDGELAHALAIAWGQALGAPVVVDARGRGSALMAAAEFTHDPHDGTVVLAGDLGDLALAYAREHPAWNWARTFEHFDIFALDPAVLVTGAFSGLKDIDRIAEFARTRTFKVGVRRWLSIDNLILNDMAAQAGLRFEAAPAGSGTSLVRALTEGKVPLAFGRQSDLLGAGRQIVLLASATTVDGTPVDDVRDLDTVLGTRTAPAGRVDTISVHADFQRIFPERYDILRRSLAIALDDAGYRKMLTHLGLTLDGADSLDHTALLAMVRRWWDAVHRVGAVLDDAPEPTVTRGKITALKESGRLVRYLGLDGKIHELRADPDATELLVGGAAVTGPSPLAALKVGMLCEIAWPAVIAFEASRLSCK